MFNETMLTDAVQAYKNFPVAAGSITHGVRIRVVKLAVKPTTQWRVDVGCGFTEVWFTLGSYRTQRFARAMGMYLGRYFAVNPPPPPTTRDELQRLVISALANEEGRVSLYDVELETAFRYADAQRAADKDAAKNARGFYIREAWTTFTLPPGPKAKWRARALVEVLKGVTPEVWGGGKQVAHSAFAPDTRFYDLGLIGGVAALRGPTIGEYSSIVPEIPNPVAVEKVFGRPERGMCTITAGELAAPLLFALEVDKVLDLPPADRVRFVLTRGDHVTRPVVVLLSPAAEREWGRFSAPYPIVNASISDTMWLPDWVDHTFSPAQVLELLRMWKPSEWVYFTYRPHEDHAHMTIVIGTAGGEDVRTVAVTGARR